MKKIETLEMMVSGGKINWHAFATGFCDGIIVGELLVGQIAAAGLTKLGCDALGVHTNIMEYLHK